MLLQNILNEINDIAKNLEAEEKAKKEAEEKAKKEEARPGAAGEARTRSERHDQEWLGAS